MERKIYHTVEEVLQIGFQASTAKFADLKAPYKSKFVEETLFPRHYKPDN